jgi:prophage regulatory protein
VKSPAHFYPRFYLPWRAVSFMLGASLDAGMDMPKICEDPLPQLDRLLPLRKIVELTSLSRATIYRKLNDRSFPPSLKIGQSRVAWREADVARWMAERLASAESAGEESDGHAR